MQTPGSNVTPLSSMMDSPAKRMSAAYDRIISGEQGASSGSTVRALGNLVVSFERVESEIKGIRRDIRRDVQERRKYYNQDKKFLKKEKEQLEGLGSSIRNFRRILGVAAFAASANNLAEGDFGNAAANLVGGAGLLFPEIQNAVVQILAYLGIGRLLGGGGRSGGGFRMGGGPRVTQGIGTKIPGGGNKWLKIGFGLLSLLAAGRLFGGQAAGADESRQRLLAKQPDVINEADTGRFSSQLDRFDAILSSLEGGRNKTSNASFTPVQSGPLLNVDPPGTQDESQLRGWQKPDSTGWYGKPISERGRKMGGAERFFAGLFDATTFDIFDTDGQGRIWGWGRNNKKNDTDDSDLLSSIESNNYNSNIMAGMMSDTDVDEDLVQIHDQLHQIDENLTGGKGSIVSLGERLEKRANSITVDDVVSSGTQKMMKRMAHTLGFEGEGHGGLRSIAEQFSMDNDQPGENAFSNINTVFGDMMGMIGKKSESPLLGEKGQDTISELFSSVKSQLGGNKDSTISQKSIETRNLGSFEFDLGGKIISLDNLTEDDFEFNQGGAPVTNVQNHAAGSVEPAVLTEFMHSFDKFASRLLLKAPKLMVSD